MRDRLHSSRRASGASGSGFGFALMLAGAFWVVAPVGVGAQAQQGDWTGWRGPARDGRVANWPARLNYVDGWPAELHRAWRVSVGLGHASPISAGGAVFVFTREGDDEVLRAVDPASGRTLWRSAYPAPFTMHRAALAHGPGPKGTPEFAGGRLFTLGISGVFSAFDAEDGSLLWRREPDPRFDQGTYPLYGTGQSARADEETGVVVIHLGGPGAGLLQALDMETGEPVWSMFGDGPGYTSPVIAEIAGRRVVLAMTDRRIVALAAEDGSVLWETPFTTPYDQNIFTPVVRRGADGDLVVFGGLDQASFAVRFRAGPEAHGGLVGETVWETRDARFYMSTPVLAGGRLVGFSNRNSGQFVSMDPDTGRVFWTSPPRSGDNAALLSVGDAVVALTTGAELLVLDPGGDRFAPARRYRVAPSPTWAHGVPLPTGVLVKDLEHLALWEFPPEDPPGP